MDEKIREEKTKTGKKIINRIKKDIYK